MATKPQHMAKKPQLGNCYWRMWTAIASSSLGDGMFAVALPLLALQYTRSPVAISGVLIAGMCPVVITALPVGTLADRVNRRRLIVLIELLRFVTLAAFGVVVLGGWGNLAVVYAAAFLLGGLNVAFDVVAAASLPSIVGPDSLVRANAHLMNAELTADDMFGRAAGGVAFALARSLPFLADAASFVASAILLNGALPDVEPERDGSSAWQDLRAGIRWFLGHPVLRLQTGIIASLAFCQGVIFGVFPLYARQSLHVSNSGYGVLLAVSSLGTVIGGLLASRIHDRMGSGPTLLVAGIIAATGYPLLALTHSPAVASAALLIEAGMIIVGNVASRSLRQRLVPSNMQGRAASASSTMIMSCIPLGALAGGVLAGATSMRSAILAAAGFQVLVLAANGPRLIALIRTERRAAVIDLSQVTVPDMSGAETTGPHRPVEVMPAAGR